jgi:hypothetical protein
MVLYRVMQNCLTVKIRALLAIRQQRHPRLACPHDVLHRHVALDRHSSGAVRSTGGDAVLIQGRRGLVETEKPGDEPGFFAAAGLLLSS